MNNTFSFKRFKQVIAYDWKRFIHNFGINLLVWISIPIMFWVTSLVFDFDIDPFARIFFIFGLIAITVMSAPSRIYGKVNLPREGVDFAMLPASSREQFLSMVFYCSIVTPALTLIGGWIVDCLMTLLPFGGFKEYIAFYEIFSANISNIMVSLVMLVTTAWAESAIFMFGNMKFQRRKAGKTFGWGLLIMFTLVLLLEITNGWHLLQVIFGDFSNTNLWIFSAIMFIIACGFYFGTYRKIKNQKY